MKAVIAAIILAAAIACASPENPLRPGQPAGQPVAAPAVTREPPTPRPTYTPYPTYTPVATATPRPTYTPYPTNAAATGDFAVAEVDGSTEWLFGAARDAYDKGQEQFSNGEYEAAIASFKEAQQHRGKPSEVLENWIGLAYDALGKYDIAIVHHSNAIAINDDAINRANRAGSYINNAQCEPAIRDAQAALAKEPATGEGFSTDAEANLVLASCYYEQSKYLQALQHADASIKIANDHQYAVSEIVPMIELRDAIRYELN